VVNPTAVDRSIEVALAVERCPAVMGDADQLQSAVQNLVSNAVKYSNPGGKVRVGLRLVGGQALLSVEDDGIGIPDSDQEHLFERFFRAGNTGDIPGTGLGLALVRQVIERHHGSVALSSVVGEGTQVTVTLPVAAGVETSSEEARNEPVPEPAV
jgi:signal transduction histidine kinase